MSALLASQGSEAKGPIAAAADEAATGSASAVDPALPADIRARIPVALARAAEKTAQATASSDRAAGLLQAAQQARTARQRVVWLQRWGSAHVQPLSSVAACTPGCDHCCHIAVHITSIEASLISAASGRSPQKPRHALRLDQVDVHNQATIDEWQQAERAVVGDPCPFLLDHRCSIYEHRPFACRTHLSLDDDDLLCRLAQGVDIPMPRLDVRMLVAYFLNAQPGAVVADIREFFGEQPAAPAKGAGEGV